MARASVLLLLLLLLFAGQLLLLLLLGIQCKGCSHHDCYLPWSLRCLSPPPVLVAGMQAGYYRRCRSERPSRQCAYCDCHRGPLHC